MVDSGWQVRWRLGSAASDFDQMYSSGLVKGIRMVSVRRLFVAVVGGSCMVGCVGPGSAPHSPDLSPGDTAGAAFQGSPEVREVAYDDGSIAKRTEGYVDAKDNFISHGNTTQYWENGRKKSEVMYVHGMRHGERTAWYNSGQMWSLGAFLNGRENGAWTMWYPNGRKAQEIHFDEGAWDGMLTYWHPNGEKRSEVEYVRGKKQGPLTEWDEFGTVVSRVEYVDDAPQP